MSGFHAVAVEGEVGPEVDQSEVDVWSIVEVLEPHVGPWDAIGAAEFQVFSFGG